MTSCGATLKDTVITGIEKQILDVSLKCIILNKYYLVGNMQPIIGFKLQLQFHQYASCTQFCENLLNFSTN